MALTPAGLDPAKPQVLHPWLALPILIRCQTPLNSLIYGDNFGNYVRVTESAESESGENHKLYFNTRRIWSPPIHFWSLLFSFFASRQNTLVRTC